MTRTPVNTSNVLRRPYGSSNIEDEYELGAVLGKGAFGTVRTAVSRSTGEKLACKSIPKSKLVYPTDVEDVQREVAIMNHVSGHPHVVSYRVCPWSTVAFPADLADVAKWRNSTQVKITSAETPSSLPLRFLPACTLKLSNPPMSRSCCQAWERLQLVVFSHVACMATKFLVNKVSSIRISCIGMQRLAPCDAFVVAPRAFSRMSIAACTTHSAACMSPRALATALQC